MTPFWIAFGLVLFCIGVGCIVAACNGGVEVTPGGQTKPRNARPAPARMTAPPPPPAPHQPKHVTIVAAANGYVDFLFAPVPDSPEMIFVECEDENKQSVAVGEWVADRVNGEFTYHVLRVPVMWVASASS